MRLFSAKLVGQIAATNATKRVKGTVIFLHGSCDSGAGMKSWLKKIMNTELKFTEFNVVYPTAPLRPYTLLNGQETRIWYDRTSLYPQMPEDVPTIETNATELQRFILSESEKTGVSVSRMVLGGFSMGGSMALHTAYRFIPEFAGVFALSSCLAQDSLVYKCLKRKESQGERRVAFRHRTSESDTTRETLSTSDAAGDATGSQASSKSGQDGPAAKSNNEKPRLPPLFMSQGLKDPIVKHPWAKSTFCKLQDHGVDGHFFTHSMSAHTIDKTQLSILHQWINQVLTTATSTR